MTEPKTYNSSEIFKPIPDDPDNVMMQIPPEICEKMGWKEGTTLNITVVDGRMIITEAV